MKKIILLFLGGVFLLPGCANVQKEVLRVPTAASQESGSEEYTIGPEDILRVNVWKDEDLTTDAVVRSDGKISVPLIKDVQASGLTALELTEEITTRLKEFIPGVDVTVVVIQMVSNKIYVQGEVAEPGPQPLGGNLTVIQALALSGGLTPYADRRSIIILRASGEKLNFNYDEVIRGQNLKQNIRLKRGDTIIVP